MCTEWVINLSALGMQINGLRLFCKCPRQNRETQRKLKHFQTENTQAHRNINFEINTKMYIRERKIDGERERRVKVWKHRQADRH